MPLPSGFAGLDPPSKWPPSRSGPRAEALERPVESLTGVGPVVAKRLAKLGLRRIGDLLRYRPRRYESAVPATADFAPVYPASEEIAPRKLRELVGEALVHARDLPDPLPAEVRERGGLPIKSDALWALHRPRSKSEAERGRRSLAFEELLVLQLGLLRQGRAAE